MILVDTMTLLKIIFDENRGLPFFGYIGSKVKVNDLYNFFFQVPHDAYQLIEQCFSFILRPKPAL